MDRPRRARLSRGEHVPPRTLRDRSDPSPTRSGTLLQHIRFRPLAGDLADYRIHVLLGSHLGDRGSGNTAQLDEYKGMPILTAKSHNIALALACSPPWRTRTVG